MLIDWFTVGVQIINFLILIALLKRFLYGPLLRVMDERQQTIAANLAKAARAEEEARAQQAALTREQEALARSRNELMRQAEREVESWREATLLRLREEIEGSRRLWQQRLKDEQATFFDKLKIRVGEQVVRIAGKVLADLADDRLEARLLDHFLVKLKAQSELDAGWPGRGDLLVATGLALSPESREGLQQKLRALFGADKTVFFMEDSGLSFGIRLTAGDQAWEWNLARYMEGLEQDIRETLATMQKSGESDE